MPHLFTSRMRIQNQQPNRHSHTPRNLARTSTTRFQERNALAQPEPTPREVLGRMANCHQRYLRRTFGISSQQSKIILTTCYAPWIMDRHETPVSTTMESLCLRYHRYPLHTPTPCVEIRAQHLPVHKLGSSRQGTNYHGEQPENICHQICT
jgi:hypothetical protein